MHSVAVSIPVQRILRRETQGEIVTVLDRVRVFNKRLLNPLMMRLAGRKYWYASVIEHTGRRSGKHYATPVATDRVPDGFVIPLPYGVDVDWLRNVLAAGHATVRAHGQTYRVVQPEIISAEAAAPQLRPQRRRTYDLSGVKNYLHMKSEPPIASS
jgi:deazaflavin-dependent oxidoreductase (nitroreductase family)